MIGKPMPERIYACQDTVVDAWGGVVKRGWHTVKQFDEEVEYVRKDCIEQYAFNDELKDGQRRWVFWRESWFLVKVSVRKDGPAHFSVGDNRCGASFNSDDPEVLEIGPVIRPPKGRR